MTKRRSPMIRCECPACRCDKWIGKGNRDRRCAYCLSGIHRT